MSGQSLFPHLTFRRAASKDPLDARDTGVKLSREILELSRADQKAIWTMLRASPDGLDLAEAKQGWLRSVPI